jgi:hypothetical protein
VRLNQAMPSRQHLQQIVQGLCLSMSSEKVRAIHFSFSCEAFARTPRARSPKPLQVVGADRCIFAFRKTS